MNTIERQDNSSFLAGLLLGALVGGATAWFFAPQSGARTREVIREGGLAFTDRVADVMMRTQTFLGETPRPIQPPIRKTSFDTPHSMEAE